MTVADATSALGALGREAGKSVSLAGSMSGSAVYRVDLEQGEAILKVTRLENGVEHLAGARRELDFYLTLAHRVPVRTARLLDHLSTDEAVILLLGAHHPAEPAASWDDAGWLEVARDLAALHDWPPPADPTWQHGSLIIDALGEPDLDMAMAFWSQPGEAQLLKPMFDHPEALAQAITAPPSAFSMVTVTPVTFFVTTAPSCGSTGRRPASAVLPAILPFPPYGPSPTEPCCLTTRCWTSTRCFGGSTQRKSGQLCLRPSCRSSS